VQGLVDPPKPSANSRIWAPKTRQPLFGVYGVKERIDLMESYCPPRVAIDHFPAGQTLRFTCCRRDRPTSVGDHDSTSGQARNRLLPAVYEA